jgi:hypothetical protein
MDLKKYAEGIPSLGSGGITIKDLIKKYASKLSDSDNVIDIGSYIGSTTGFTAAALIDKGIKATIHCFDPWMVDESLKRKMKFYNELDFNVGDDLLPVFNAYMEPFNEIKINRNKISILDARWHGPKVQLLIDDICLRKDKNDHMIKIFSPYFIPGKTIIIRLDYYFYESKKDPIYSYEKRFMELNKDVFKFIERGPQASRAAVFMYMGGEINYGVDAE